jgi:hypothetical protein
LALLDAEIADMEIPEVRKDMISREEQEKY